MEVMEGLLDGYALGRIPWATAEIAALIAEQAQKGTEPGRIAELVRRSIASMLSLDAAYIIPRGAAARPLGPAVPPWSETEGGGPHGVDLWPVRPDDVLRRNAPDLRDTAHSTPAECADWASRPDHARTVALAVRDGKRQPLVELVLCRSADGLPFTAFDAYLARKVAQICVPVFESLDRPEGSG